MKRDKNSTKQSLLDSVGVLLEREGFRNLGINAIAREAGCDKVLIYRYFGSLEGLLDAYLYQNDFYTHMDIDLISRNIKPDKDSLKETVKNILSNQLKQTSGNRGFQEILRWELVDDNEVLQRYATRREASGHALTRLLMGTLPEPRPDLEAMIAVFVSGIYYLVLRSKYVKVFNGVVLENDEGWNRINLAVDTLLDFIFENIEI